jgi:hypothetical protein
MSTNNSTTEKTANPAKIWPTVVPVLIAIWLPIWQMQFRHGWLEMALGQYVILFWALVLFWAATVGWSIRQHRRWWLLLTGLPVLYPVLSAVLLLRACVVGDCL